MNISLITYDDRKLSAQQEEGEQIFFNQKKCGYCGEHRFKNEMHSEDKCKECKSSEDESGDH